MPVLADGTSANDSRLGRLIQFDERSRNFPIRSLLTVEQQEPRSYTWRIPIILDQLSEGSCVGHSITHELIGRPVENTMLDHEYARGIYFDAQRIDPWEGGAYDGATEFYEGTSVLAGMKVAQDRGHYKEYRWAFDPVAAVLAISYRGPVVLGINWMTGFFEPDSSGQIKPTGSVEGGHAIAANRVVWNRKARQVWLTNSWGPEWGLGGRCWLTFEDFARILSEDGECAIPHGRTRVSTI